MDWNKVCHMFYRSQGQHCNRQDTGRGCSLAHWAHCGNIPTENEAQCIDSVPTPTTARIPANDPQNHSAPVVDSLPRNHTDPTRSPIWPCQSFFRSYTIPPTPAPPDFAALLRVHPEPVAYELPRKWIRLASTSVLDHLMWYLNSSAEQLPSGWDRVEVLVRVMQNLNRLHEREINIYAYAQHAAPLYHETLSGACAGQRRHLHGTNLIHLGVDGKNRAAYHLQDVTGLDFRVQSRLIQQTTVACSIVDAILTIEDNDCNDFAFICHGGTHRSVGCACLLLTLAYPRGKLLLTTQRTQKDAISKGCVRTNIESHIQQ